MSIYSIFFRLVVLSFFAALVACSSPQTQPISQDRSTPTMLKDAFLAEDGYRLPLAQYWPGDQAEAIVIALHGFNDYRRAFEGMCPALAEKDIACLAYDQRGFGETEYRGLWPQGKRHEADLKTLVSLLRESHPGTPIYVTGESMGGAIIISALSLEPEFWRENIKGAALFAPAVWARSTQPWYQRLALWAAVHTFPDWKPTGESLEIVATDNIEALREMGRDPNIIKETRIDTIYELTNLMDRALENSTLLPTPVAVFYGEKDEVIPKWPTCEFINRIVEADKQRTLKLYSDGYHMLTRDLQASQLFSDVSAWVLGDTNISNESEFLNFCETS